MQQEVKKFVNINKKCDLKLCKHFKISWLLSYFIQIEVLYWLGIMIQKIKCCKAQFACNRIKGPIMFLPKA